MSIRTKLIVAIGLPLAVLLAALLWIDYVRLKAEAFESTRRYVAELAGRYAALIDADLREAAARAAITAETAATLRELDESGVLAVLAANVRSDSLIYGSSLSFVPGVAVVRDGVGLDDVRPAGRPAQRDAGGLWGPYVFRTPDGLRWLDLALAYDFRSASTAWWPQDDAAPAFWSEPYFDAGGGEALMVTRSVPVRREGRFVGVATVDVRLADLQRRVFAEKPAEARFFILSPRGTFIVSPFAQTIGRMTMFDVATIGDRSDLRELATRMVSGERDVARFRDTETGEPMIGFFTPIRSAGWSLTGLVPESVAMRGVNRALMLRLVTGVAMIGVILGIVVVMGSWLTRPIGKLAEAVENLGTGDLEAQARDVRASDEIGRLARRFNAMVVDLRRHVEALTKETAARQGVERELELARKIQTSMLPREYPACPGYAFHAVMRPAKMVGGDFFELAKLDDQTISFGVADVSGKGMPAALFMAETRTLLRSLAWREDARRSPADTLRAANEQICRGNETGMFLTVFAAALEWSTGKIHYANAGHPPAVLVRRDGGLLSVGDATGTVLGMVPEAEFHNAELELAPGDRLVLYTDGVSEARRLGDPKDLFGVPRLLEALRESGAMSAQAMVERVLAVVDAYQGPEQSDDITVLVIERRG